jgi:phosphate transport system ATP-binding protein
VTLSETGDATPTLVLRPAEPRAIRGSEPPAEGDDIVIENSPTEHDGPAAEVVFEARDVAIRYSGVVAVEGITLDVHARNITALIGPSGCGKSTFLRSFNRMNDLIPGASVEGYLGFRGQDLYGDDVDPIEVRRRIGMVFQKPNPFPKSIYDNVAFGPRVNGVRKGLDEIVEKALVQSALFDEVKDKLKKSAFALSGGQQQRLCIARCLAVEPDVILMDEPCSALDPIATSRIEDLMAELKRDYTIVVVTHNMQQAARVSDMTAFMTTDVDETGHRTGRLVEYDDTNKMFTNPADPRTEGYITGRFG